MKVYISVAISPFDDDLERFAADESKPLVIDRYMTADQIYSLLLGALSPLTDKAASGFANHKDLVKKQP